ncbi:MAG: hypothetical protein AAF196_03095 [Planctomycetota bacterium]
MRRLLSRSLPTLSIALLGALSFGARAIAQDVDISIAAPRGWIELPADQCDRGACRAYFCAERPLPAKGAAQFPHTPTLRVLVLNGTEATDDAEFQEPPFANLDDYVARIHVIPGRIVERGEVDLSGTKDGTTTLRFEALFEQLGLRMSGLSFTLPSGSKALVLAEYLDVHQRDMRKMVDKSLSTIQISEAEVDGLPIAPFVSDRAGFFQLSNDERSEQVVEWATNYVERASQRPGDGWKSFKNKTFTVFTRASTKDTKRAVQAAESMRSWIESQFEGLGGDVGPAILRIYGSPEELAAAQATGIDPRPWDPATRTMHFAIDVNAGTGEGYGLLLEAVGWNWIDDRVPGAMYHAPRWFLYGFNEYLRSSKQNKKTIEFFPSEVEDGRLEWNRNNDRMLHVWDIVQEIAQPEPENGDTEREGSREWDYTPESTRFLRWMFEHDGHQALRRGNFAADYIKGIGDALTEAGPNPIPGVIRARTEDSDEGRAARKRYFEWRKSFRDSVNNHAAAYDRDVWFEIDKAWMEFVGVR